ncbi:MAG TPA: hypothetical protein VLD67_17115 [Vicinamibacterales bacterium]|nr:hypothetical protein [Vicinamibacterales bacterium]
MRETDSFEKPESYAEGVPVVVVNGIVVIDKGEHTGARPGKALRGASYRAGIGPNTGSPSVPALTPASQPGAIAVSSARGSGRRTTTAARG